jgi:hypothetical protein
VEERSYAFSYFDRKIEAAIAGLPREYSKLLNNISNNNALIIANYIISMKTEINLSDNYRKDLIKVLSLRCFVVVLVIITNYHLTD